MSSNAISYNKATSQEFGWQPAWFGASAFDWDLIKRVKAWQQSQGLGADGYVGSGTYKELYKQRKSEGKSVAGAVSLEVLFNRTSQKRLGWKPSWLGCRTNDETLVYVTGLWQQSKGMPVDGLIGDTTYRRLLAEREARAPVVPKASVTPRGGRNLILHGKPVPIEWDKVVLWSEEGGLKPSSKGYRDYSARSARDIKMFVNHWDACTSAASCAKVLNNRGLGVHFCLDNDGTIYQMIDMQNPCWHAKGVNLESVGVEISNAVYPKYQSTYEKRGFGPRPIIEKPTAHGKMYMSEILGLYEVQEQALKALWKAVHLATGMPLEVPLDSSGNLVEGIDKRVTGKTFRGFCNHYNLNSGKYDFAGLDMVRLMNEVRAEVGLGPLGGA